jgi:branched-chain amino acid transport system ATP-binding protein
LKDLLVSKNLVKTFGGLAAVNDVSIKVRENSITLLMGPNGSGKSTFVNMCTGVLKPDSGSVVFDRKDITGFPPYRVYELGFVRTFQIPAPFPTLMVLDNVLAAMRNPGESPIRALDPKRWVKHEERNVKKALEILGRVGLGECWDKPACALGGGQLKLLELARALAADAKLIALDEPIGGVDPAFADKILCYVTELKKTLNLTFLIIEHRIDIAAPYADYAYVMEGGRVLTEGKPDEVVKDPRVIEVYIG